MNCFTRANEIRCAIPRTPKKVKESLPSATLLNVPLFHATGCLSVMIPNTVAGGKDRHDPPL